MEKQEFGENTKLAKIRKAMENEDWKIALKIASTFRRLGDQKTKIRRAAESYSNPEFYIQMGFDIEKIRTEGIDSLKERFSKSWEISNNKKEG